MSLRSFLEKMESASEVVHVTGRAAPRFEISSIMKTFADGPILCFEDVEDYETKVVGNVCGTRSRICSALEVHEAGFYQRMIEACNSPRNPVIVDDGPAKEIVEKPNLRRIPILTHCEKDAGAYITSGVVSARSPDGNIENVSIHRLLILDEKHLAIRLVPRHLYRLWRMAKEAKQDLDVAIAIGVHPAVSLAAASSPPFGVSEFRIANSLLGMNLRLIRCMKVNVYAPADAELILEGRISSERDVIEGPLVDITGTYDIQRSQPVIEIVNVLHRDDYLYQALLPGGPEHRLLMGLPREAVIYETVSRVVPTVKAVNLTVGGCGWLHAVISIEKQTDGDAKNAMLAAFAGHPSLKRAIVVDTDINVFNSEEVEWAVATRFQADEDMLVVRDVRGSTLDPSADQETGLTTKLGMDATRSMKITPEKFERAKIPTSKRANEVITSLKAKMRAEKNPKRPERSAS